MGDHSYAKSNADVLKHGEIVKLVPPHSEPSQKTQGTRLLPSGYTLQLEVTHTLDRMSLGMAAFFTALVLPCKISHTHKTTQGNVCGYVESHRALLPSNGPFNNREKVQSIYSFFFK